MRTKKLERPITLVVEIQVKTWRGSSPGDVNFSSRATVNRDYANEIQIPMQYGNEDHAEDLTKLAIIAQYPRLKKVLTSRRLYSIDEGVFYSVDVEESTKARCLNFGGVS